MNLHRVQQKWDKVLYQEYEKYRTVQHKKRKATLPKIAYPAMMDICEAKLPDDTSLVNMEEGINDRKYYNSEQNDEKKEAECPYETSPVDTEEGVNDRRYDKNEKNDEEKEAE